MLLDRLLADAGIPAASVAGPEAASHLEVAIAIAAGQADTGLGVHAAATAVDSLGGYDLSQTGTVRLLG